MVRSSIARNKDVELRLQHCEERNTACWKAFEQALFDGNVAEAQRLLVKDGAAPPEEGESGDILVRLLQAKRFESFELLLQSPFARWFIYEYEGTLGMQVLLSVVHELCRFPRNESVVARLEHLVGSDNPSLNRVVGKLRCRDSVLILWGVLRRRFTVPSSQSCTGSNARERIPRDMINMLTRMAWQLWN